jgi:RNA methyltransferase, TrmH family
VISSRHNPAIKRLRALLHRRERDRTGLFLAEGIRIVTEAIHANAPVQEIVFAPDLLTSQFGQALVQRQAAAGARCTEVSADAFRSLSLKERPQGLVAVVRQRWERLADLQPGHELCWIALNEAQDPGNLGAILRTGDATGAAGVILLGQTTDPYDPAAVRASMGAIFAQRLVRATFAEFIRWAREHRYVVVGAADAASVDYRAYAYAAPLALLMGSEQHGLSAEQQAACQAVVRIPMVGASDSLNLAVATSIILYELFNQRRALLAEHAAPQQVGARPEPGAGLHA